MPTRRFFDTSGRLFSLACDIRQAESGAPGFALVHDGTPLLEGWALRWTKVLALTGIVYGHPSFVDRRLIVTSDLYAIDPVEGWARTHSRYYRLGRAADEDVVQHG